MGRDTMCIENERLLICSLESRDLEGLKAIRGDRSVYRHEPTFLLELRVTPEEALEAIRGMSLR